MRTSLVATRATSSTDASPEAEPVIVDVRESVVRLELDDGQVIDFDVRELRAAVQAAA